MASWTTPKTDWTTGSGASTYDGDRFSYIDFNRIMNNILYLYELAVQVYQIEDEIERREADPNDYFILRDGYSNRTQSSYVYADEINYFEERLYFLKETCGIDYPGTKKTYLDNGIFINADELNILEGLSLAIKEVIYPMFISRRMFAFTLSQATNHMDL